MNSTPQEGRPVSPAMSRQAAEQEALAKFLEKAFEEKYPYPHGMSEQMHFVAGRVLAFLTPARASVSPATGGREAELRRLIQRILFHQNNDPRFVSLNHITGELIAALTPLLDHREGELAAWQETAAQAQRGLEYYCGLLDQMAPYLGEKAFIADDSSVSDSPLRAKLPELVLAEVAENAALRTLVAKKDGVLRAVTGDLAEMCQLNGMPFMPETVKSGRSALALTPASIADELAAKDALIAGLRDQVEVRGQMRDEAIQEMNKAVQESAAAHSHMDKLREHRNDLDAACHELEGKLRESEAARGEDRERLLNVARGCHDYGGGYREPREAEIFHHGIQTVINSLEAFSKNPNDTQTLALERAARAQEARPHLPDESSDAVTGGGDK